MPKKERIPFPQEDAPGYDPENPYADKVALTDHRHYMLGQYFIQEARVRVRSLFLVLPGLQQHTLLAATAGH